MNLYGIVSLGGTVIGGSLNQRGLKGETGVGITNVDFDANYDLDITYTDGTVGHAETEIGALRTEVIGWKDDAEEAATNAGVSETNAGNSATSAYGYQQNAYGYKQDAETAMLNAQAADSGASNSALVSEGYAVGKQGGTDVSSGSPYYHNNAKYYSDMAAIDASDASDSQSSASGYASTASSQALKSEGYAVGKQNGSDVPSGSDYYQNNSKYYKEQAATSASNASTSALKSEGYAVGEQNGTVVSSDSPYYENNAKYYSDEASDSSTAASASALVSEGFAVGEQNGTPVTSGSPYYENNSKYYADLNRDAIDEATIVQTNTDNVPYLFRPSGGDVRTGRKESDTIVGGTVGWNQLVQNGNFADSSGWAVSRFGLSVANNVATLTALSTIANSGAIYRDISVPAVVGHKYLYSLNITPSKATQVRVVYDGYGIIGDTDINASENVLQGIASPASVNHKGYLYVYPNRGGALVEGDTVALKDVWIVDLTAYFGSATIADYVYTLESGTAGAGVAWLKENAPQLFEYHAYDAGSLVSVSGLTSHDMVGKNLANIADISAPSTSNTETSVSLPNGNYTLSFDVASAVRTNLSNTSLLNIVDADGGNHYFTDATVKKVSDNSDFNSAGANINGRYYCTYSGSISKIVIYWRSNSYATFTSGAVRNIQLEFGSIATAYEPYVKHSYSLDSDLVLRGIPKLDASNNLYYDGDRYNADGSVDRRYGVVDLGTLTWTKGNRNNDDTGYIFRNDFSSIAISSVAVCSKYTLQTTGTFPWEIIKKGNFGVSGKYLLFADEYASAADFKTAMDGVYLVYELATPTTETADPYTNPQIVDPHGTEEYVGSPIPVGHETDYPMTLTDTMPTANGNYTLTLTVANGKRSVSWTDELGVALLALTT